MKHLLVVLAVFAASSSAFAELNAPMAPDAWVGARPSIQIAVTPGRSPDYYTINAVVTDLRSGAVMAKPVMNTRAGVLARAEVGATGAKGMISVAFNVTVDPSGQSASYSSEVRDDAEVISSQSATIAVIR